MRRVRGLAERLHWPVPSGGELVITVLFVQLISNAALLTRLLGHRSMAIGLAGFAVLMYCGAIRPPDDSVRRALGWVGGNSWQWIGAGLSGVGLGTIVTATNLAFGHSIQVIDPFQNQVFAISLGPIVEEICLRGVLLPLLIRPSGSAGAILITSLLFAVLHGPASILKLVSITVTGVAYGCIRICSKSTALAALSHAMYNLSILRFGLLQ